MSPFVSWSDHDDQFVSAQHFSTETGRRMRPLDESQRRTAGPHQLTDLLSIADLQRYRDVCVSGPKGSEPQWHPMVRDGARGGDDQARRLIGMQSRHPRDEFVRCGKHRTRVTHDREARVGESRSRRPAFQ
ncbi:Uncharacterised protein [Mycobacteroides abscessus subsp. bolletii]|nr:Uncharacterised protein [Mycobacteroides abscessus subsp. bolletii]SKS75139.1 Uncharacterised protein [Mycobacteroides abscessus subsp. bolletii]